MSGLLQLMLPGGRDPDNPHDDLLQDTFPGLDLFHAENAPLPVTAGLENLDDLCDLHDLSVDDLCDVWDY